MTRFYISYTPVRRGLTGMEMLPQYLDEYFSGVKFHGVTKDGLVEYGYLEGSGDMLSKSLQNCSEKFSIKKLDEDTFIGFCYPLYNPAQDPDGAGEVPTFSEMMSGHGVTVPDDVVPCVKKAQKEVFKEVVKKEFMQWNDSIADVSKVAVLYNLYTDTELTSAQKTQRKDLKNRIKAIYTPDVCLAGMENIVDLLENVLTDYYTAKAQVDAATTVDEVLNISYK